MARALGKDAKRIAGRVSSAPAGDRQRKVALRSSGRSGVGHDVSILVSLGEALCRA